MNKNHKFKTFLCRHISEEGQNEKLCIDTVDLHCYCVVVGGSLSEQSTTTTTSDDDSEEIQGNGNQETMS